MQGRHHVVWQIDDKKILEMGAISRIDRHDALEAQFRRYKQENHSGDDCSKDQSFAQLDELDAIQEKRREHKQHIHGTVEPKKTPAQTGYLIQIPDIADK